MITLEKNEAINFTRLKQICQLIVFVWNLRQKRQFFDEDYTIFCGAKTFVLPKLSERKITTPDRCINIYYSYIVALTIEGSCKQTFNIQTQNNNQNFLQLCPETFRSFPSVLKSVETIARISFCNHER